MKWYGRWAWLLVLIGLLSCQSQSETWQKIQQTGVLRVGLDPTFPPFEQAIEGDVWGLDVDLAQAIAAELGLPVNFSYFGYDGLYDALATEQVDVLISALVVQPERTEDFSYSQPYFNAGQILVVPQASTLIHVEELTDERVSVELGAEGHVVATTWARRLPALTILPANSVDEALLQVVAGEADVAIMDSVGARLFLRHEPSLLWLPEYVVDEPYAAVVRAEDETLLAHLNEALQALENAGRLDEIVGQWLDTPQ